MKSSSSMQVVTACLVLMAMLSGTCAYAHDAAERTERDSDTHELREGSDNRREHPDRGHREDGHGGPEVEKSRDARADDSGGKDSDALGRDIVMRAVDQRIEVERDSVGRERRSGEVLMIGRPESVEAVRAAGYVLIDRRQLASVGEIIARIRLNGDETIEQTVSKLQIIAPTASLAPNHIYRPSQSESLATPQRLPAAVNPIIGTVLGVIDAGADPAWAPLSHAIVSMRGFAGGGYVPRAHGTVVAEIAARGGAQLVVADVFGTDGENRLVASAEAIAGAIDWLITDNVTVINISIEGPDNLVLSHVIKAALARNLAIVAAAGNGGPAAPPAFPAAYPGVIAVTAIDEQSRVYRRANRGDYIVFAARGAHIVSGYGVAGPQLLSGTSFAAPVVAAAIASRLDAMHKPDVRGAVDSLRREAVDLGAAGRDPIYGWGEIR